MIYYKYNMASAGTRPTLTRAGSLGVLNTECMENLGKYSKDITTFIADSDKWGAPEAGRGVNFAQFCEEFNEIEGGSGMIQKGGADILPIDDEQMQILSSPNIDTPMPEGIKKFIEGSEKGIKTYLAFAKGTTKFFLIKGVDVIKTFKGYVYVGTYITLNTYIFNIMHNGQCILWNNSNIFAPTVELAAETMIGIFGSVAAVVGTELVSVSEYLVSLAGFNPTPMGLALVACACLAAYLAYRFFNVVENTELTEDQIKDIKKFRVKALIEKFKVHANEIGEQEVKKSENDTIIAGMLVEIEKSLKMPNPDPADILQKYSVLFNFVNKEPIKNISIAYLYASYIRTVLSSFPEQAVVRTIEDFKQIIAIVGGVNTRLYPDLKRMSGPDRVRLFKLEFNNILNDLMAIFVVVSGPVAAAGVISRQLVIFGNSVGKAFTEINITLSSFLEFVQAAANAAKFPILDEHVKFVTDQAPPDPMLVSGQLTGPVTKRQKRGGGSSSRRRRKLSRKSSRRTSRKPRNKRKTIRKKVSKTRKRTLNKKSKKRSKKLRR